MFELKAKRLASVFLALIIALFAGCSGVKTDPLAPDPTASAASPAPVPTENASETVSPIPTQAAPTDAAQTSDALQPPMEFYSFTAAEAVEEFGSFAPNNKVLLGCDGKHIYLEDANGTLVRSDYPGGGNEGPVCKDPLCTHRAGSACPLADFKSMFSMACYDGKLFYISNSGSLNAYDAETNQSRSLLEDCDGAQFHRYSGQLYIVNNEETDDFRFVTRIYKVSDGSRIEAVGTVNESYAGGFLVHSDRDIIGFDVSEIEESLKLTVVIQDILSGETHTVFERSFDNPGEDGSGKIVVFPLSVFGDKVLFSVRCSCREEGEEVGYSEIWLVDVMTGEGRLLVHADDIHEARYCQFSEKRICYVDFRKNGSEHYVIHVIDPFENEEKTFDLSEMADGIGETIPLECYLGAFNRFAPKLQIMHRIPYSGINDDGIEFTSYYLQLEEAFIFDLESGRAFKYPGAY